VNIRTVALGVAIAGLAVAGCDTAATVASRPEPPLTSAAAQATTTPAQPSAATTSTRSASARPGGCDPALWRHVYHPYRLHVISACTTVTGIIEAARKEPDGDYHILLKPDRAGIVNSVNVSQQHGDLVLEPVCENPVTQADAIAACSGFMGDVRVPPDGTHVSVTGSYVLDADHGWMEIHPVSRITVTGYQPVSAPSSSQPSPSSAAPAPSATSAAAAGCYPKTSGGNCYEPGEFCSTAEHGETGVAGNGKTITCTDVNGTWRWED